MSRREVLAFFGGSDGKESACSAGDLGSIPGLGRFLGEGDGNPLQYSCLEDPTNRGAWRAIVQEIAKGNGTITITEHSKFKQSLLHTLLLRRRGFPDGSVVKNPPAMWEIWVQSLGWEDPLENGMATHSSILVWRIPWTVSTGLQRVGHD